MRAFILFVSSLWGVVFSRSNSNTARPGGSSDSLPPRSGNPFDSLDSPGKRGSSCGPVRVSGPESYLDSPTSLRWTRELTAEEILEIIPPEKRGSLPSWSENEAVFMRRNGFALIEK